MNQAADTLKAFPEDLRDEVLLLVEFCDGDADILKQRVESLLDSQSDISSFQKTILLNSLDNLVKFLFQE